MSIRAQQIAELEAQLALHRQTEEAHEAWLKDKSTPIEFLCTYTQKPPHWLPCSITSEPAWLAGNHYRIAPKPKLRPWKPEEAIGKVVRRKGSESSCLNIICTAHHSVAWAAGDSRSYPELLSDFEQLDGSPCGVMEP